MATFIEVGSGTLCSYPRAFGQHRASCSTRCLLPSLCNEDADCSHLGDAGTAHGVSVRQVPGSGSFYVSATRPWSGHLSPALPCVLEGGGGEDAFALSATPPSRSGGLTSHRRDLCWHFLGCGVLKGISRRKKEFMGPRLSHLACEQHRS